MQIGAETVGDEVFLKGEYIELGIHAAGSFGSYNPAPEGFNPVDPYYPGSIGFVANNLDYFLPGSPFEGWTLEWSHESSDYHFYNYGLECYYDIPMTSSMDTSVGDALSAFWAGTATSGDMAVTVTQTVAMEREGRSFTVTITLENTGSVSLDSVEYLRTVDPDNEQISTDIYDTINYVTDDPYAVHAKGMDYGAELILTPITPGGQVGVSPGWSMLPDHYLDYAYEPSPSAPSVGDYAIGVAYRFETLDVGERVSFAFSYSLPYAYVPPSGYVAPSPVATLKPVAHTLLDKATEQWDCITAALPAECTSDISELICAVETCMAKATSLTNPICVIGTLNKACAHMETLCDLLSCSCRMQ